MLGVPNFLWQILARLLPCASILMSGVTTATHHDPTWLSADGLDDHIAFRITPVLNDLEQLSRWRMQPTAI